MVEAPKAEPNTTVDESCSCVGCDGAVYKKWGNVVYGFRNYCFAHRPKMCCQSPSCFDEAKFPYVSCTQCGTKCHECKIWKERQERK